MIENNSITRRIIGCVALLFIITIKLGCNNESVNTPPPPDIRTTLSKSSIAFGSVIVGQSAVASFSISNSSSSTGSLTGSISITGSAFSMVSGGGSFSISPGQSRTVTVRFSPSSASTYSGSVRITHNGTNQSSPATVSLSGTGQVPTTIVMSVSQNSINFGTVTVGQTSDQNLTINNSSTSTASLTGSVTISGSGFSIVSGGGSLNLSPGQSKTVTIRFSPSSQINHSGSVNISHNATNQSSPSTVSLSGVGGQPGTTIVISVNPSSIDFGTVAVGQSSNQSFIISNSSTSTASLTGNVSISGIAFSIVSGGGAYNLSPGQSKTVTVRFSPQSSTSYSGSVSITHNATNQSSPTIVSLSGSGQGTGSIQISVSRTSINFGTVTVGQSSDQSFSINNSSSSTGNLMGNVSVSGSGFSIISGGGSYSLSPGQSRTVTVRFAPTSATNYSGSVSITHNATNQNSPIAVSLSGSGQSPASIVISISRTSINFGTVTVGQSLDQSFTINNSSSSTGNLMGNVSVSGPGFSIISGSGSYNLSPGQSRTVTVRFSPTSATNYSGSVSITHNATNQNSPTNVSLSGVGQTPTSIIMSINRIAINFGTVRVGQTNDDYFTISNSSSSNANLTGNVTISGAAFSIIQNGGAFNISPGQSRTVTVRFSPPGPGGHSGSVTITHNSTNLSSPAILPLTGTGEELQGLIVGHRGYTTSTHWTYQHPDIHVGHVDNPFPIQDVQHRGFAWFTIPSWIRTATITEAYLIVDVQDINQWNDLLVWVDLEHLGSRTWASFYALPPEYRYDALIGTSVSHKPKATTLNFPISPSSFYLFQQAEIGFSFRAVPEIPSGGTGNQTHRIILNNPFLYVRFH